ncbi:MAG: DoxX family protein [Oligoflexales bacterium]
MKAMKVSGWVLSALISAFLAFGSASGKFTEWEGKQELFDHLGYSADTLFKVGIGEVCLGILFLIPGVDFFAALLLTAFLGGATATHVRVGDPFYFPILIGVLAWIALALRNERLRNFLLRR